jgi:hypothetical protein
MLGRGAQSKVFVVEDTSKPDLPRYAMKVLKKEGGNMTRLQRTVAIDSTLWHDDENDTQEHKRKVWVEVVVGRLIRHARTQSWWTLCAYAMQTMVEVVVCAFCLGLTT